MHLPDEAPAGWNVDMSWESFGVAADYLVLAGDIQNHGAGGILNKFLQKVLLHYEKVFFVLGNNEYKTNSINNAIGNVRTIAKRLPATLRDKLVVLEKDRYDLTDSKNPDATVSILGCTLWTDPVASQMDEKFDVAITGNSSEAHKERFAQSFEWLKEEVTKIRQESPERKILVVTHRK